MSATQPLWHVVGHGAQGCLWGARLSRAGERVCLLLPEGLREARASSPRRMFENSKSSNGVASHALIRIQDENVHQLRSIPSQGIQMHNPKEFSTQYSVEVPTGLYDDTSPIERVLIASKAYNIVKIMQQLKPRLGPSSVAVILCQQPAILAELEKSNLNGLTYVAGTTMHSAYATQRFHVVHTSGGAAHLDTWFGLPRSKYGSISASELQNLVEGLKRAQLGGIQDDDIEPRLWERLTMACGLLPVTALFGVSNGQFARSMKCRQIMRDVVNEATQVLVAENMTRSGSDKEKLSELFFEAALDRVSQTEAHFSSMSRDTRIGRRTEIDYFNGFIVKRAKDHGFSAPVNSTLCNLLGAKRELRTPGELLF